MGHRSQRRIRARPVVLIVLDGWGIAPPSPGNAISLAKTPTYNRLFSAYPHSKLQASGKDVGLPVGEDGNTEVGHLNLGAGQVVYQDLPRLNMAITEGTFFENDTLLAAAKHVKTNKSNLHLMGLIGSGGVHAYNQHLYALLKFCQLQGLKNVFLHLFTDGRDSHPTSSLAFITEISQHLQKLQLGQIASVVGRYYAMDRDFRWDRTHAAYLCLTQASGAAASSAQEAITSSHAQSITDEFIKPTIITDSSGNPLPRIQDNDAVVFYNYRVDRPLQLAKAFVLKDFETTANQLSYQRHAVGPKHTHFPQAPPKAKPFPRDKVLQNLYFATMTEYQKGLPAPVVIRPNLVNYPLARVLADHDLRQLHIAESEKERFVTYYFNGLRDQPFLGEDHLIIPSPKVSTYDLKPEMSTSRLAKTVVDKIKLDLYDFILVNIAAPDMVAHTGKVPAAIKACETTDLALNLITSTTLHYGGAVVITSDHGNAEEMLNLKTGKVDTEHSTNPVPLILVSKALINHPQQFAQGKLADVAPTILNLMQIPPPTSMTGVNLLE